MTPPTCTCAAARLRPAELVNTEIRQLAKGTAEWTPAELAKYARLRAEWGAAKARETVVPAA
jgi:hypothetical protein